MSTEYITQGTKRIETVAKNASWSWGRFSENISISLKSSGLIIWFFIFFLALLEVKQYYNIDVIPNYNSSVDDAYGAVKGTISEVFK